METEKFHYQIIMWLFVMVLVICAIIQFDAVTLVIPNQIVAMSITLVVWGIGAIFLFIKTKKRNIDNLLYNNFGLSSRDGYILFYNCRWYNNGYE